MALAALVRQSVKRLATPLEDIFAKSRSLVEQKSSLSEADRATLREIIADITRIAKELKSIVVEGDKSNTMLKREAERIRDYTREEDSEQKSE